MFSHIFINKFKIIIKNKSLIFWTIFFPIILATLFNLAFNNLRSAENFEIINLAVIDNQEFNNNLNFKTFIESLSKKDDNQIFKTKYVNLNNAKELLEDNKISGYIFVNEKIELIIKTNGLNQTIIQNMIDSFYQISSVTENILEYNPAALKESLFDNLDYNYIDNDSYDNYNINVTYFYTLIGMVCLYSGLFGVSAVNEIEANLSMRGARTNVAPTHKLKILLASLLVSFIINFSGMLILLFYLLKVLGINFGNQISLILLIAVVGIIAGISMGLFIGLSNKKSKDSKIGIVIAITMLLSFLSGMMSHDIKYLITNKAPIIGYINPVNMITDGLYSLYYYDTLNRYFFNLFSLIIFAFIMFSFSYIILRRKNYDSI